ncbi:hypothetical protein L6164_001286 [Bauhinia variegata]|uniref:Uncharacterized protein n=1 Tax=Bauhinia variegata TaxID=167791 RepID=A0ACB9Q9M1_BAUVA|nr:hypothetical protein L6164_001286 [Bauhinia variegata]
MLHLAQGDIAKLLELCSYNWVVMITGWMSNCSCDRYALQFLFTKTNLLSHLRSNPSWWQFDFIDLISDLDPFVHV